MSKEKQGLLSLLPMGRQVFSHAQEAGLHRVCRLLWKTNTITSDVPSLLLLPPALYAEQDPIWFGISFWSVGVGCPSCVSSKTLVHPQCPHWWRGVRGKKGLGSVLVLLSSDKDISVLSLHCFQHKFKQPCTSYCREN